MYAARKPPIENVDPPESPAGLVDLRFRTLLGEDAWLTLPEAVRRRFSKRIAAASNAVYGGHVAATELSPAGRVLANFARVIGAPLPLTDGAKGAAVVIVAEEPGLGGQTWTRSYARPGRFPQVVHSAKRFAGPTGLEEYVGRGFGMALRVTVEDAQLVFRSAHYFVALFGVRLKLPRVLSPGVMEIVHRDEGGGAFSFRLTLTHARFGRLVYQLAYFTDR